MKVAVILAMVSLPALAAQSDPIPARILEWVKPGKPLEVTLRQGVLRVVTSRDQVTPEIYHGVVVNQICTGLMLKPASWGKTKISRIEVVNNVQRFGYAFEGGNAECLAMGELTSDQISKDYLPKRTKKVWP